MIEGQQQNRSGCPIATTLDVVGDKWTLVIVRDMLNGKSKFSEFLGSPERITTNVLTSKLAMLLGNGLAKRKPYQVHPPRYQYLLTEKGVALAPVLLEMCAWANKFYVGTWTPPEGFGIPKSS
jgi:DNA-binding HxlR family transcriptional regulator